eukprot:CAMPEP_0194321082 /NCGR_PEP_ID=MMETSP0171-20130528/17334_1 /TAXON_ID=218684 /ORGANISM="Corethron pennatum, Strain L29A3" /LENGTH=74 /DNA_ID=CAMNT_0039078837 /DNA_START=191 /DNA_END=414 /DNA_ORIENTATION=-
MTEGVFIRVLISEATDGPVLGDERALGRPAAAANADKRNTRFLYRFLWGGAGVTAKMLKGFPVQYKYMHAKKTG